MKDALLQQNIKGRLFRLLVSVCVFVLVSISAFAVFEFGFADEGDTENLIEDIALWNEDDLTAGNSGGNPYGYASNPDNVTPIEISAKGGQVNLVCVAWWDDNSQTRNPTGLTITSSNYDILEVNGMTITARHDGEVTLTVTVSEHTKTGEPIVLEVPVIITGQDKPYVTDITLGCDSDYYDPDYYAANGYMYIETDTLAIYISFYALVTVFNPSDGTTVVYDTRNGLISAQSGGDLADIEWCLQDSTLADVSDDGLLRPTEYGNNSIWAASSSGLKNYVLSNNTIAYQIPNPDQSATTDGHPPQDHITFNIWYENDSVIEANGNFSMPTDPNLVKTLLYDEIDLRHAGMFYETYTLVSGSNLASVTAQGYGVDLEALLIEACGLDADQGTSDADDQGTSAIQTLRFYDAGGDYKQMSASWLFQTRYYYPNIDVGSKAAKVEVKPMLAFKSWWQRGVPVNWDIPMSESTRFRLILGSTSLTETVTSFSWKWVNRIDVILEGGQPVEPDNPNSGDGDGGDGGDGGNEPTPGDTEPEPTPGNSGNPDTGSNEPNTETNEPTTDSNEDPLGAAAGGTGGSGSGSGGNGTGGFGNGLGNGTGNGSSGSGVGGGMGTNPGIAAIGSSGSGLGGSLSDFYSTNPNPDSSTNAGTNATDAQGEGSDEGANEGLGSGINGEEGTDSGRYSLYQVMNPFTSDIGVQYEDNPLTPFVVPVSCGVVALGVVKFALWFAMQRRRTQLLVAPGAGTA